MRLFVLSSVLGKGSMRRLLASLALVATLALTVMTGSALAGHYQQQGWRDRHANYPSRPNGTYAAVTNVFGAPCSSATDDWVYSWPALNPVNNQMTNWPIRYHGKMGRPNMQGSNSNFWDVRGHIGNAHLDSTLRGGMYGYLCRHIKDDPSLPWSKHAWGIAVDIHAALERVECGHDPNTNSIHNGVESLWSVHGWYQLPCDLMHFQYSTEL